MIQQDESYLSVLHTVRTWPARQRYLLVQDLLKTLEPAVESTEKEDTLSLARGLLATDKPAPTDEEVAQWLEEHRLEKYG
jgi:hypothetical protein